MLLPAAAQTDGCTHCTYPAPCKIQRSSIDRALRPPGSPKASQCVRCTTRHQTTEGTCLCDGAKVPKARVCSYLLPAAATPCKRTPWSCSAASPRCCSSHAGSRRGGVPALPRDVLICCPRHLGILFLCLTTTLPCAPGRLSHLARCSLLPSISLPVWTAEPSGDAHDLL